jgi:hypothetical protein
MPPEVGRLTARAAERRGVRTMNENDKVREELQRQLQSRTDLLFRNMPAESRTTLHLLCVRFEVLLQFGISPENAFSSVVSDWMTRSTDILANDSQLPQLWPISEVAIGRYEKAMNEIMAQQNQREIAKTD